MLMNKNKVEIKIYLQPSLYEFINKERGIVPLSTFVRELLSSYQEMCVEEDRKGDNENKELIVA